jgi:hypothetical protein
MKPSDKLTIVCLRLQRIWDLNDIHIYNFERDYVLYSTKKQWGIEYVIHKVYISDDLQVHLESGDYFDNKDRAFDVMSRI